MDITMTIGVFLRKALPKWWIIAFCAVIGFGAAFYSTMNTVPSYYTDTTLVGVNFDGILSRGAVSVDELTIARRIVTELMPVATSRKVATDAQTRLLDYYNINLSASQIQAMISVSMMPTSNILVIRAYSNNPTYVVPVANEVSDRFMDTLNNITGISYFSILDLAETVYTSSSVNKRLVMAIGFLGGGVIGLVVVFLMVLLTRKINMVEDLISVTVADNLALIPNHSIKY